ncbi:MAG: nucleotide-binding protein [Thermodesulfovibrionales bacterium]|jgi:predicted nucleotide-binding protein
MEKEKIIEKLNERLKSLLGLSASAASDPSFKKWRRDTDVALEHLFGKDTRHIRDFRGVRYTPGSYNMMNPEPAFARAFVNGKASAEALLQSMIDEVQEYWTESGDTIGQEEETNPVLSNKVFIVHGHNEAARESVARLITQIGLDPIILHEQPNKGKTIIEKFVDYSDVGFAVVILTADDRGGKTDDSPDAYKPRARQNVILELGFFLGRIGRERVCALYEEGVEIPSDYDGVVFVPLDKSGGWRLLLGRELRAAGLDIDLNKII